MKLPIMQRVRVFGEGNSFDWGGISPKRVSLYVCGNANTVVFEQGSAVKDISLIIVGSHNSLHLAKDCNIEQCAIRFNSKHANINVGPRTHIVSAFLAAAESETNIEIGADCLFAAGLEIRTGDGHSLYDRTTKQRINRGRSVKVGDRVWLCSRVRLAKGSIVPGGCVIAADSLVNKSLPESNAVYAGRPVLLKRRDVLWEYCLERTGHENLCDAQNPAALEAQ